MTMVVEGTLAAYVSGTWDSGTVEAAYGTGYAATKLPTFDVNGTATQMGSFAGYTLAGVNAYSDQVDWAMVLAEYISSEESQIKLSEAASVAPANTEAANSISSPALAALSKQSVYADQQVVGTKFWTPAANLGTSLVEGAVGLQTLLDEAVAGITQLVK